MNGTNSTKTTWSLILPESLQTLIRRTSPGTWNTEFALLECLQMIGSIHLPSISTLHSEIFYPWFSIKFQLSTLPHHRSSHIFVTFLHSSEPPQHELRFDPYITTAQHINWSFHWSIYTFQWSLIFLQNNEAHDTMYVNHLFIGQVYRNRLIHIKSYYEPFDESFDSSTKHNLLPSGWAYLTLARVLST